MSSHRPDTELLLSDRAIPSCRWCSISLSWFLALLLSWSCIGWTANVKDGIFLRGPKSSLLLETFFQCPPHSNGRHLQSGDKNTVCDWFSAQYWLSNVLRRFWYYSHKRFRHIYDYFKLIQSRYRPPWQKIQYLLQQVGSSTLSADEFANLLQLGHTSRCSTNCKLLWIIKENGTDTVIDLAGTLASLCFLMGMSGGQVAGYSQNTSILPIPVSTNQAI